MKKHSRFLSLVLRHQPEAGGITLNEEGWAPIPKVLDALREHVGPITRTQLDELVATNDKQRFALDHHRDRIRANQGHSVDIDLKLEPQTPPPTLYHGTKQAFVGSIMHEGLKPGKRQHVHLSRDVETAMKVAGRRQGDDVLFMIDTTVCEGPFFESANGVWLTHHIPATALCFHSGD